MHPVSKLACLAVLLILTSCSSQQKPTAPFLTPEGAAGLLHNDGRAEAWLITVKKRDPSCEYKLDLPDQTNHPTDLDVQHIVSCGGRPAPLEFDAKVSFSYDKDKGQWVITRFSS